MDQSSLPASSETTASTRKPVAAAVLATVVILLLLAAVSALLQMVALNGAGESQGLRAIAMSLACQGMLMILLGLLVARATTFLITTVKWNSILAIVVTVVLAAVIGGSISFLAGVIAIPIAGIR